jgi:hypothetical protein
MCAQFVAWYNFSRRHMTLKTMPALAAGLTAEPWTMERPVERNAQAIAIWEHAMAKQADEKERSQRFLAGGILAFTIGVVSPAMPAVAQLTRQKVR